MIDLHLHTTASDGLLAPAALIARAAQAGLTIVAVTDHDTVGGLAEAIAAGKDHGVRVVTGIEITAIDGDTDVHVLGYFIDPGSVVLARFLQAQREDRTQRVRQMGVSLGNLGMPVDVDALIDAAARERRSIGRPAIADALVRSGHAADRQDAFARWLGRGRPAFVPRRGIPVAAVIDTIHAAGGVASFAHPGIIGNDALLDVLAPQGLDAVEVWHSDHSPEQQQHYAAIADRLGLARSGGSDFHGDGGHHAAQLGSVVLPQPEFQRLETAAEKRR